MIEGIIFLAVTRNSALQTDAIVIRFLHDPSAD
jgi:hypothetical protein